VIARGSRSQRVIVPGKASRPVTGRGSRSLAIVRGKASHRVIARGNRSRPAIGHGLEGRPATVRGNRSHLAIGRGLESRPVIVHGNRSHLVIGHGLESRPVIVDGNRSRPAIDRGKRSHLAIVRGNPDRLAIVRRSRRFKTSGRGRRTSAADRGTSRRRNATTSRIPSVILGADIVRWLLSSGGIIIIFLIVSVWVYAAGRTTSKNETRSMRRARQALLAFALAVTVFSIYGLEYLFARLIVGSLKPFDAAHIAPSKRTAIVLLGSGSWHVIDWDGRMAVYPDPAAATRELEAARVFRLVNPAVVISSGGNPHPHRPMVPGGEAMREHLVALGVPVDRILVETESDTTRDEALIVDRMLKAQAIEQVILVTSETHMRRSLAVFRSVGIEATPAIAQEFLRGEATWPDLLLPSQKGLDQGSQNAHEVLGLAYYWLRGWHR
jgi:uncharacterized SAM-binding protein YcdF (DUF218 family)